MKIADFIIIGLALGVNIFLFTTSHNGFAADHAHIQVADFSSLDLDLARDQVINVQGLIGETQLQVSNGAVRILASPCRHKICIRRGWLRHGGESNACLPNGLSIRLSGGTKRFDSTNY